MKIKNSPLIFKTQRIKTIDKKFLLANLVEEEIYESNISFNKLKKILKSNKKYKMIEPVITCADGWVGLVLISPDLALFVESPGDGTDIYLLHKLHKKAPQ